MSTPSNPLDDVQDIAVVLTKLANEIHSITGKLERAVEGVYASEISDPRVQLLTETLRVLRNGDFRLAQVGNKLRLLKQHLEAGQHRP